MNKVFFFEGIHGCGKSTLAKKKADELQRIYPNVHIVTRTEKPCPIDICRLAVFSEEEFEEFLRMIITFHSEFESTIKEQLIRFSSFEGDHYYVNWFEFLSQCHLWDMNLTSYAFARELCDGKAGYEQYKEITRSRWQAFAETISDNTIYLFEGALLQHPITELIGYYEADDGDIIHFVNTLLETMCKISTELIYVSTDQIEQLLLQTAKVRNAQEYHWMDGFIKLVTTCNYGKKHGLSGFTGVVQFCKERIRIEQQILDQITINKSIFSRKLDASEAKLCL